MGRKIGSWAIATMVTLTGLPNMARAQAGTSINVDPTGKVGIGTASPATKLHVSDSTGTTLRLEQTTGAPRAWDLGLSGTALRIRDVTSGDPTLTLRPGTTFPNPVLEIVKTNPASVLQTMLKLSNYGGVQFLLHRSDTDVAWQFSNFGQSFQISRPGLEGQAALNLTEAGELKIGGQFKDIAAFFVGGGGEFANRVGIGTVTPASKLEVKNGDIRVTNGGFIDDGLPVPDYVFEPSYQLMPIEELAAFIEREKHLPEIPSATAFAETGVNLGELQMKLLQKVEELTLYIVAQNREIRDLRESLARLQHAPDDVTPRAGAHIAAPPVRE